MPLEELRSNTNRADKWQMCKPIGQHCSGGQCRGWQCSTACQKLCSPVSTKMPLPMMAAVLIMVREARPSTCEVQHIPHTYGLKHCCQCHASKSTIHIPDTSQWLSGEAHLDIYMSFGSAPVISLMSDMTTCSSNQLS